MKSARGIYYNLNESDYIFEYNHFKFYFSSVLYLNKYKSLYQDYIEKETKKLNAYYKANINCEVMLLLTLYKKIEKRGFKVVYDNKDLKEDTNLYYVLIEV